MNDGIYYVTKTAQGPAIEFLNFAGGKSEMVAPIGKGYVGFQRVTRQEMDIICPGQSGGSDLVLVEGFR